MVVLVRIADARPGLERLAQMYEALEFGVADQRHRDVADLGFGGFRDPSPVGCLVAELLRDPSGEGGQLGRRVRGAHAAISGTTRRLVMTITRANSAAMSAWLSSPAV